MTLKIDRVKVETVNGVLYVYIAEKPGDPDIFSKEIVLSKELYEEIVQQVNELKKKP